MPDLTTTGVFKHIAKEIGALVVRKGEEPKDAEPTVQVNLTPPPERTQAADLAQQFYDATGSNGDVHPLVAQTNERFEAAQGDALLKISDGYQQLATAQDGYLGDMTAARRALSEHAQLPPGNITVEDVLASQSERDRGALEAAWVQHKVQAWNLALQTILIEAAQQSSGGEVSTVEQAKEKLAELPNKAELEKRIALALLQLQNNANVNNEDTAGEFSGINPQDIIANVIERGGLRTKDEITVQAKKEHKEAQAAALKKIKNEFLNDRLMTVSEAQQPKLSRPQLVQQKPELVEAAALRYAKLVKSDSVLFNAHTTQEGVNAYGDADSVVIPTDEAGLAAFLKAFAVKEFTPAEG